MFYPKDRKTRDTVSIAASMGNYFLAIAACVLLVFPLGYAMMLCAEIPVSFSDREYGTFFSMELALLVVLALKVILNLWVVTVRRHGKITAAVGLLAAIVWILFLANDVSVMAAPQEAAFRTKVLLMDVTGLLLSLAAFGSQLLLLLRRKVKQK